MIVDVAVYKLLGYLPNHNSTQTRLFALLSKRSEGEMGIFVVSCTHGYILRADWLVVGGTSLFPSPLLTWPGEKEISIWVNQSSSDGHFFYLELCVLDGAG